MNCLKFFVLMINSEKQHGLRMPEADYAFYRDQTRERVGKFMDAVVPFSSANKMFLRCHSQPEGLTCSSIETAAAFFRVCSGCKAN